MDAASLLTSLHPDKNQKSPHIPPFTRPRRPAFVHMRIHIYQHQNRSPPFRSRGTGSRLSDPRFQFSRCFPRTSHCNVTPFLLRMYSRLPSSPLELLYLSSAANTGVWISLPFGRYPDLSTSFSPRSFVCACSGYCFFFCSSYIFIFSLC